MRATSVLCRYALDVNAERAEDVVTHQRLLEEARNPQDRPALSVRVVQIPYDYLTPLQAAIGVVQKGIWPTIPKDTNPKLAELLQKCWHKDSTERPDFSQILDILQRLSKEVGADGEGRQKTKSSFLTALKRSH
ncbi:hypothetical protein ZWY2020_039156 [Hordeum vulgare]|nr:hypothetical protein ZWY2020_039156 [Hordeum vulgare]